MVFLVRYWTNKLIDLKESWRGNNIPESFVTGTNRRQIFFFPLGYNYCGSIQNISTKVPDFFEFSTNNANILSNFVVFHSLLFFLISYISCFSALVLVLWQYWCFCFLKRWFINITKSLFFTLFVLDCSGLWLTFSNFSCFASLLAPNIYNWSRSQYLVRSFFYI